MTPRAGILLLAAATLGLWSTGAAAERYRIPAGEKTTSVRFISKAPMETFEGTTREMSGVIEVAPASLGDSVTVAVEVDLASLDTGIKLRNKHMRENHLETDRFPKAFFRGGRVLEPSAGDLTTGETVSFRLRGTFELHGVAREIEVPVEASLGDGRLVFRARFEVPLADYGISRPKLLMLKLNEIQEIEIGAACSPEP